MKLSIRSILLFGSVLLLPIVLILNFFVYQKSQEETYIQAIEKRIHAVEVAFNLDFELFQRLGTGLQLSFFYC
jgi:two-component system, NtrC family, nitrogen regulation sensor histidine kinase NtrY